MTTYLMIHGGSHAAWCWTPLLPWLNGPMLAIDLPGRGKRPAPLDEQTYRSFAESAGRDILQNDLYDITIVAHSMGGITAIGLMDAFPDRIHQVIFIASPIPRQGESIGTMMQRRTAPSPAHAQGQSAIESGVANTGLVEMLYHDLNELDRQYCVAQIGPESMSVYNEPVRLDGLKQNVPRTYVKTLADRGLPPELQDESIGRIPNVQVRTMATGHTAMFADPKGLADIIENISTGIEHRAPAQ